MSTEYEREYPFNLIDDIFADELVWEDDADHRAGLEKALGTLAPRERAIVQKVYEEHKSLATIAKEYRLTPQRISEIRLKALRKLRHQSRTKFIEFGVVGAAELDELKAKSNQLAIESAELEKREAVLRQVYELLKPIFDPMDEEEKEPSEVPLEPIKTKMDAGIEALDLTCRSHNCLLRMACTTVADVIRAGEAGKFLNVRSLGRKSLGEIIAKVKMYCDVDLGIHYKDKYTPYY